MARRYPAAASVFLRQEIPDSRIFIAENPGTEAFEPAVLRQLIAFAKAAQVSKEDPLAHLVAIEEEPCGPVGRVPLDSRLVGCRQQLGIRCTDVVGRGVRTLDSSNLVHVRCACEPVVAVERNAK